MVPPPHLTPCCRLIPPQRRKCTGTRQQNLAGAVYCSAAESPDYPIRQRAGRHPWPPATHQGARMRTSHDTLAATPPEMIDLACTLAEARREAARALRIRYVYAANTAWAVATEPPRDRRA